MTHLGRREWDNDVFETRKNVKWKKSEKNTDDFFLFEKTLQIQKWKSHGAALRNFFLIISI